MSELKHCPFCGGEARFRWSVLFTHEAYVECVNCGSRTMAISANGLDYAKKNAAFIWNRRVTDDEVQKETRSD